MNYMDRWNYSRLRVLKLTLRTELKGIFFMSHAHEDHVGALSHILKDFVPYLCNKFYNGNYKDNLKVEEGPWFILYN